MYTSYIKSLRRRDLEFTELLRRGSLNRSPHLLFLARDPATPATTLLVKLVDPKWYSEEVHRVLTLHLCCMALLVCRIHRSAIIMEYPDPPSGWTTLQNYIETHREIKVDTEYLALVQLLKTIKEKVVCGDLRITNITSRVQPEIGACSKRKDRPDRGRTPGLPLFMQGALPLSCPATC